MSTLKFKNINKIYANNVQAVHDFNLEVKDKEFVVFVGPSGCGKSTTLRMVAGLESITSGELYIDDKLVNNYPAKDRDIAMVFQSYALYPHMTVYKNLEFGLKLRKIQIPLYNKTPETLELENQNKLIWKQIDKINRKFAKKQDDFSLNENRVKLYEQIEENILKMQKIGGPVIGKNVSMINYLDFEIQRCQNDIDHFLKLRDGKYKDDPESVDILNESIASTTGQLEKFKEQYNEFVNNDLHISEYRKLTKREMELKIYKVAESIDLTEYLYRKPVALSGGQRQRVALGRAIVRNPRVFLMDEPLSNLDAKLRVQTRTEISRIHKKVGATTIYVTHDQTEAMTMADRIVIMKDGFIQQVGSPSEVYENPSNKFVAGFIGFPSMNFINVNIKDGKIVINLTAPDKKTGDLLSIDVNNIKTEIKIPEKYATDLKDYEGKDVILGIRPTNIWLDNKRITNSSEKINCSCDFSELLGDETILYTYNCGQRIVVQLPYKAEQFAEKIDVYFDLDKLYFFDKESEKRIA